MKQLLLALTLCLSAATAAEAQTKKELAATLSRDLAALQNATQRLNFDSLVMFMPPAMFNIMPKDSLVRDMNKAFDNEYFSMQVGNYRNVKIPKPKKAGNYHYSLVEYVGEITMKYKTETETNKMMANIMKMQFGKDNVEDMGAEGLKIKLKNKKMIAFKDPSVNHWYIVEDKRQSKEAIMMDLIVPVEVLEALDK